MYKYFNKIISVEIGYNWDQEYKTYTALRELEINSLKKLIEFAADSPGGDSHIDFIQSYISIFQNHVNYVKSVMESMEIKAEELLEVINGSDGVEGIFTSNTLGYFWYVDIDTIYFFKPHEYDHYLKSQSFSIFEVENTSRGYKVQQHTLGFTNEIINEEISNEPLNIKKQIEKFSTIDNLADVYSHREYCENLLKKFFGVRELVDIKEFEDTISAKLLGNPLEILREIWEKSKFKIIELSLPQELKVNFNKEIQKLIDTEFEIFSMKDYKELLSEERYAEYCERLNSKKSELMTKLSFQQKQLDEYMSYLPKEFY